MQSIFILLIARVVIKNHLGNQIYFFLQHFPGRKATSQIAFSFQIKIYSSTVRKAVFHESGTKIEFVLSYEATSKALDLHSVFL